MLADLRWSYVSSTAAFSRSRRGTEDDVNHLLREVASLTADVSRCARCLPADAEEEEAPAAGAYEQLVSTSRSFLDAAASLYCRTHMVPPWTCGRNGRSEGVSESLPEAMNGCEELRRLLRLRPVVRVVREFVGGLLYVVVTSQPLEEDVHSWSRRAQLVEFLHVLCGIKEPGVDPEIWHSRAGKGRDSFPCPECACRHVAIQEALSLVRYLHDFVGGSGEFAGCAHASTTEGGESRHGVLPLHMADGLGVLVEASSDLVSALHPRCSGVVVRGASGSAAQDLCWRTVHADVVTLRKDVRGATSWRALITGSLIESALAALETAVDNLERAERRVPLQSKNDAIAPSALSSARQAGRFGTFPVGLLRPSIDIA
eukprot:TRINITY_DN20343_c0_g1_i1.p1 TRINITY_DN20343_c0_g1~~TRINITY_DN20343_c0_g1_i1.p1  ORF type:complete len:373 (-),score=57.28 TRINITY_DN20343_c0_g1_i1:128-1246(-)